MSKDHHADSNGQLRKPGDRSNQPGQGADLTPAVENQPARDIGETAREYEHSSGDRNDRADEDDWPEYRGGTQRNADPAGATEPQGVKK